MTDQTPVTPPPPPPPAPTTAEAAGPPTTPAPPAPPTSDSGEGGRKGRKAIIGGIAAAVILGGGYGAYAVYDKLDGGGAQPHDVMPASTQVYARLDLDPSAGQKIDLFKLIRKVPDLADEIGIKSSKQDIRELVFREAVAPECDSLDYDKDVEPWLGDRIGVGGDIKDQTFVIAVQTSDEDAARAGIKKLFACADEPYGIAFSDGYALLSETQADVDAAVKATAKGSLGDKQAFVDDFDQLGDQGVASGWVDLKALAAVPEIADVLGAQVDELSKAGSAATTLRTSGDAIELAVLGGPESTSKTTATALGKLPKDTVAALSIAGVGDQVTKGFDSFLQDLDSELGSDPELGMGLGSDAQGFIDEIEQQTGFKLPEDLATLFGDSLTLALGSANIENIATLAGPDDFAGFDLALSLATDKTAGVDLVERIADLASGAGIPLVAGPTDDGAVLATNQDAADAITDPEGKLGDSTAFRSVIPEGNDASGGFYVDISTILDKVLQADPPADIRQEIESASALSAFGVSHGTKGDRSLVTLRLSFK